MSLYMFQKIETGLVSKAWVQIVSFVDRFHASEKAFAKAQQEFVSWILKELPYKQSLNQTSFNGFKDLELIFGLAWENTIKEILM